MLGKLGTDIDKTHEKMVKVDSKLKELIASSSQFCLWVVIFIEIAVLILVIVIWENSMTPNMILIINKINHSKRFFNSWWRICFRFSLDFIQNLLIQQVLFIIHVCPPLLGTSYLLFQPMHLVNFLFTFLLFLLTFLLLVLFNLVINIFSFNIFL